MTSTEIETTDDFEVVNTMSDEAYSLLLAEETLILQGQMAIQKTLNDLKLKQSDLAQRLGVRESYVSQMLGISPRNLTLRTIARVMHALGTKVTLELPSTNRDTSTHGVKEAQTNVSARARTGSDAWGEVIATRPRADRARGGSQGARAFAAYQSRALQTRAA